MRKWLQFSVFPIWFIVGLPALRWLIEQSPPKWLAAVAGIGWLLLIIPVFIFAIGYHESPSYLKQSSILDDATSAWHVFVSYLKYLGWLILLGVALFFFAGIGYSEASQLRSSVERHAFVKENACPATDRARLPCPGYHVDHIVPLCAGGADHRSNMQWLTIDDHKAKTKIDVRTCAAMRR